MKIKIEGWVLLKHRGQLRFSAVHDSSTNQTTFGPATQNTGYVFETDLGQPTVDDYVDQVTQPDELDLIGQYHSVQYLAKKELAKALVNHYLVTSIGPAWVKAAIVAERQFNISENDLEHEDYGKFDFFFYVDPVKD